MAKRRKKTAKRSLKMPTFTWDSRYNRIIGLFMMFFSIFLFIAFTSYIFTWKVDQDKVLKFSWSLFSESDVPIANWMGRLGAILSNFFFYWGTGISSFFIVYILGKMGLDKLRGQSIKEDLSKLPLYFLGIVFLGVVSYFVFHSYDFPFGGSIGQTLHNWLTAFIGKIGLLILLIFVFAAATLWAMNPNFDELTPGGFFADMWQAVKNIFVKNTKVKATSKSKNASDVSFDNVANEEKGHLTPNLKHEHLSKPKIVGEVKPLTDEEGQMALDLSKYNEGLLPKKQEQIPAVSDELEIAAPDTSLVPQTSIAEGNKDHKEPYDPTLELSNYKAPSFDLLDPHDNQGIIINKEELENNKDQIITTLLDFGIKIIKIKATIGPTVTLYEIVPAPGVRISKIKNLEDDIALTLAALGIRIIAPIPGRGTIGIEVPNKKKQIVGLRDVLDSEKFLNAQMDLPIALGKTISDEVFVADLAKMPHLLVAGATGQGKSVGINTILMSLLYKKHPSQVKLVLIDPKKVELSLYSKLEKHFLCFLPGEDDPIITETKKVVHTLNSLTLEMDQRYTLLKKANVRNLKEYNNKFTSRQLNPLNGHKFLPYIVLVIDEFADLIMTAGKEVEMPIGRLAQLARAIGIHLIIATQRPSVNIITGVIKANFPARIGFKVSAKVDSRTILDAGGADQLIGRGDMLLSVGGDIIRLQCAFVDTHEVDKVIHEISLQQGYPEPYYLPEFHTDEDKETGGVSVAELDEHFSEAARMVVNNQSGSTSSIQRRMKLGYNRAGRIMDQLEAYGIVGPSQGSKAREVYFVTEMELDAHLAMIFK